MCAGPLISSELLIVLSSHNSWFGWLWWVHRTELVAVEGCNGMMETQWQQMASWPKANAWASSAICHLAAILSSGMAPVRYGSDAGEFQGCPVIVQDSWALWVSRGGMTSLFPSTTSDSETKGVIARTGVPVLVGSLPVWSVSILLLGMKTLSFQFYTFWQNP